jgi:hypothetical protein
MDAVPVVRRMDSAHLTVRSGNEIYEITKFLCTVLAVGEQALHRCRVGRRLPAGHLGDPVIRQLDEPRSCPARSRPAGTLFRFLELRARLLGLSLSQARPATVADWTPWLRTCTEHLIASRNSLRETLISQLGQDHAERHRTSSGATTWQPGWTRRPAAPAASG